MIDIKPYTGLSLKQKIQLDQLINNEFGHIDFISTIQWAVPDFSVRKFEDDQLVCFYNVIKRTIDIDGNAYNAMGVSNVITPAPYRGRRLAFDLIEQTQDKMMRDLSADLGLLLCAEEMIRFYQRLGWEEVNCKLYYNQDDDPIPWQAKIMLLNRNDLNPPKQILLNGTPW
jgi:hypothetical protein